MADTRQQVDDDVWEAYEAVLKQRTSNQLAAVFALDESDRSAPRIVLRGTVALSDNKPWKAMVDMLDEQQLSWIALTLPYKTQSGGQREKFCFVRWCSDNLTRDSFKESVRLKSGAVMFGYAQCCARLSRE